MLRASEIKRLITDDWASSLKKFARKGQRYYEGDHDIRDYRLFYYNDDGELIEDKYRSNIRIPHPFYTELTDQGVQYILSTDDGIFKSDDPELQAQLDDYFNENEDFMAELSEVVTGSMAKGFEYMYAYKNDEDKTAFMCADSLGVVEVRERDTDEDCMYIIYWYVERIEDNNKKIKRIEVWTDTETYYYMQEDDGEIKIDEDADINPKPHIVYRKAGAETMYGKGYGFIPFFRLDNNKKRFGNLKTVKDLIDDYDLMASSLSNNLVDFDTPLHVIKGYEGDDLDKLQKNLKTKKLIGTDEDGGVEIHTVDVPYAARVAKLELDEKNIYRFGFGLNLSGLKDTSATTNVAIKAAYSLLDLRCSKFIIRLKQFLRKLLKVVLSEINEQQGTDYQLKHVYFCFNPKIMSNAQENAQIALTEAQEQQTRINTLLALAMQLDNETLMQNICNVLDIDYNEIKDKLPDPNEAENDIFKAETALGGLNAPEQPIEPIQGAGDEQGS